MITKTLILLLFYKIAYAQLSGEFWWLSDKVTKLKGVKPSLPKFEKLTEFDTDESAKITFIDEDAEEFNTVEEKLIREPKKFLNTESIYWPDGKSWNPTNLAPQMNTSPMKNSNNALNKANAPQKTKSEVLGDVFTFKFPNDDYFDKKYPIKADFIEDLTSRNKSSTVGHLKDKNETSDTNVNNKPEIQDLFIIQFPENGKAKNSKRPKGNFGIEPLKNKSAQSTETIDQLQSFNKDDMKDKNTRKSSHTEHICTYMKKSEYNQKHGTIYFIKETPKKELIAQNICCILPLLSDGPHRIVFPDAFKLNHKRSRRSNKEESTIPSLKQRDFLLKQKFRPQNVRPTTQTKIVTPDYEDYVDPYWNIKSSSIKKPGSQSSIKQDCNYQDYVEDYTVELPRPGLVGIYSDSEQRPPWSFSNGNRPLYGSTADYSEEEDGTSFGYSTVDPRVSSQGPKRGKPIKLTTTQPEEVTFDIGSQTVSFQSSPNFQVLQGFKLLNLGRNKNKFYSKNTRRSTTEGVAENDSNEPEASHSALSEFNGTPKLQIYDQCGKSIENTFIDNGDKDVGEAASGSHPWMALVVLTKRPQGILCYATIIHPKAAITAADCVYGFGIIFLMDRENIYIF